jgi:hypothetical protein
VKNILYFIVYLSFFLSSNLFSQFNVNQHPDDIYWSDKFANPGLFNRARVVTNYNSNTLLFAGHFFELPNDSSQGLNSYLLAFWNGTSWKIEGPGRIADFNGEAVSSICVIGTDIYIGGNFTTLSSEPIAYLARWDGNQWSEVGGGVNGPVHSLATDGSFNLYVGGNFNKVGDKTAYNIAKWNGSTWSALEDQGGLTNGVNGTVSAIAVGNNGIYVGGGFSVAGGTNAKFAAKYTSTGSWEDIGISWLYGGVLSIAVTSEDVYLGGAFTEFNGAPGNGIVKSDGSGGWVALGNGSTDGVYKVMASAGGTIYALGDFSADAGSAANRIAMWNGSSWEALGDEPFQTGDAVDFTISEPNTIYTTKFAFQNPNYVYGNGIYKWDGSEWSGLGQGIGDYWTTVDYVRTLEWYDSKLVAGGYFLNAGDKYITSLAQFDGDSWSDVGGNSTTANFNVLDMMVKDGKLFAAGTFLNMGGVDANNIAVWNGSTWSNLGLGVDNYIQAMHSMGDDIYVTGPFFNAGGSPAVGYARWDGASWHPLGSGGPSSYALANIGNDLFAGGRFSYLNEGGYLGNIARWDGTTWNEMNSGVSGPGFSQIATVRALAVSGNNLIVGGEFDYAGATPAKNIAIWDGSQWSALGDGLNGVVRTILVEGNDIYVGGQFTMAGNTSAYSIVRWDGSTWHPLGTGLRQSLNFAAIPTVASLLATPEGLYVGGRFTHAGNSYSNMIALYTDFTTAVDNELNILPSEFLLSQNYPNPFNPSTTIQFSLPQADLVKLSIYNVLGELVASPINSEKAAGIHSVQFNADGLASGIYYYTLKAGSFVETKKMILVK